MNRQSYDLLLKALRLPLNERAEIAAELRASLDGNADADADAAWCQEVERRAQRAIGGLSSGTDWQTVRDEIERRLDQK